MPSGSPPEASEQSAKPFLFACCILLVALQLWGILYTRNPHHWTDFRAFYAAGTIARTHPHQLYDFAQQAQVQTSVISSGIVSLYFHPSYEALLFVPLSLLPYRIAYLVYMAFGVVLLVASFSFIRPVFSAKIPGLQPRPGLMMVFFLPIIGTILWGQDSMLFLFLCCLAWRQLERGKDLSAGCILALALFRFQLAIPIAILTAVRRGWRFSAGFLASAAAVILLCFGIVGKGGMAAFFQMITQASLANDQGVQNQFVMGVKPLWMPNLSGLLYALGTRHLSPHTAFLTVTIVSLCFFAWTAYRMYSTRENTVAFAMAILCAILVSYHFYTYDMALLILPLALLSQRVPAAFLWVFYVLPLLLVLVLHAHSMFLLSIPLLGLLMFAGTSARHTVALKPQTI